jgi:hypothetical protein
MNSEGVSHEELVGTCLEKVDVLGNSPSKVVPGKKSNLEKHTTEPIEESKENTSRFEENFSPDRSIFNSKNEKDNFNEESKDEKKKVKTSSQEYEDTVISNDRATAKVKDSSDEEDFEDEESEETKNFDSLRKVNQPPAQDDGRFQLLDSTYN